MNGKVVGVSLVSMAAVAGIAMYWLQVYAFYEEVTPDAVSLVPYGTETPEEILADDIRAIDADSSPIRFRACFSTDMSLALLTETYEPYPDAVPLTAPGWFDCFDAEAIAAEMEAGTALAFLGRREVAPGVDRIVVITEAGEGFIWQQLSACGEARFSGKPLPEGCEADDEGTED